MSNKRRSSDKRDKGTIFLCIIIITMSATFGYCLYDESSLQSMLMSLFMIVPMGIGFSELIYQLFPPKE